MLNSTEYCADLCKSFKSHLPDSITGEILVNVIAKVVKDITDKQDIDEDEKESLANTCIEAAEDIKEETFISKDLVLQAFNKNLSEKLSASYTSGFSYR